MILINPCKPFYIDKENKTIRMGNFKNNGKEIGYEDDSFIDMIKKLKSPIDENELVKYMIDNYDYTKDDINSALEYLKSEGIIVNNEEYEFIVNDSKYNRQNLYFSMLSDKLVNYTDNFKNKRILILGLGGIGSNVALMLSRSGFNNFCLVDCDHVEESNLIRQYPYTFEDIGLLKTDALEKKLDGNINKKNIKIESSKDIEEEIINSDFVICTLDKPQRIIRRLINKICIKNKKPVIFSGFSEHVAMVGPFVVPNKSACLMCNEKEMHDESLNNVSLVPSYGPICNFISGIVTNEIINYYSNYTNNNLIGKTMMFDMSNYEMNIIEWNKNDNCKECGINDSK